MLREDWTYAQLCQAVMQVSPSHSVAGTESRALEWAACLPESREFAVIIMGASPEEMDGGT